jgi:hypothetical protein
MPSESSSDKHNVEYIHDDDRTGHRFIPMHRRSLLTAARQPDWPTELLPTGLTVF